MEIEIFVKIPQAVGLGPCSEVGRGGGAGRVPFSSQKSAGHLPGFGPMEPPLPRGLPISNLHKGALHPHEVHGLVECFIHDGTGTPGGSVG